MKQVLNNVLNERDSGKGHKRLRTKASASKVSLEFGQGDITTGKQNELEKENKEWRKNMLRER